MRNRRLRLPGPATGLVFGVAIGLFISGAIVYSVADSRDHHVGSLLGLLGCVVSIVAAFVTNVERGDHNDEPSLKN